MQASALIPVEVETEEDGRFIAAVPALPGVMAYGRTREEALREVQELALRVIADRIADRIDDRAAARRAARLVAEWEKDPSTARPLSEVVAELIAEGVG